jgi:LacI family transcriptional regulator
VSTSAGRATLATIASAAGVSVSTVSKVLNGRPDVAPATRTHVESVLSDLSYVPRRGDRSRAPSVALLFHGPLTTYSLEILEGIMAAATDEGVDLVVTRTDTTSGRSAQRIRKLSRADWQAVIAVTTAAGELSALQHADVPFVVIDPIDVPHADYISVGSTNFSGGLAATQHLLSLGHRRIAYLGGPVRAACNHARLQGYRGAMDSAGAKIGNGYVRTGQFQYDDGVVEGSALLDLVQPPTAIFAANDEMALGVLEAARTRGLRVPEDVSVVGFDDTEVARVAAPPLTTVAQPLRRMGAVAFRTALRLGNGEHVDSHHVELATELVVRNSTAPPAVALTAARGNGQPTKSA